MNEIDIYSGDEVISRIYVADGIDRVEGILQQYDKVFAVMDRSVAMKCPAAMRLAEIMNRKHVPGMLIKASEEEKTMETVMDICSWLMDNGADRDALVLAVGGGITSDMVGFAASIYKRGVRFAYVPTTLLAQVDAAIGGKTGVNFESYKNMLGVIRQPEFTYICPQVLESLPLRDFLSGAAEMLKTFMIEDGGHYDAVVKLLFRMQVETVSKADNYAAKSWSQSVACHAAELTDLITAAASVKAGVVSRDQFEKGERRKLNLGHTFAHAIETLAQKSPRSMLGEGNVTHGEAVAMGLVMAARLSDRLYGNEMSLEAKVEADLMNCGIPCDSPFTLEAMADVMAKDKKAEGGKVHFVVPRAIGDVQIVDMTIGQLCDLMA